MGNMAPFSTNNLGKEHVYKQSSKKYVPEKSN